MPAKKGPALIDPEPFTVIVGVAGIVGGVASVIATLKSMAKESPVANRQAALELLDQGADELRYVSADLETIREVLADAEVSDDRRFRLETVAFLKRSQFARYERTTDQMYARLRRLLKITNKLDPLLPRLPDISVGEASRQIGDARGRLNRVFRDPDISIEDALNDITSAIRQIQELVDSLRSDLQG